MDGVFTNSSFSEDDDISDRSIIGISFMTFTTIIIIGLCGYKFYRDRQRKKKEMKMEEKRELDGQDTVIIV